MRVHNSLTELIGDTPLLRLHKVTAGASAQVLAKIEYFNPGGSVKDRIAVRMVEAAEASGAAAAGRHDRRAHLGQHRRRAGHRRAGEGLPLRLRLPRQGGRRQDRGAARVRRGGRRLPLGGRAGAPGVLLLRLRPPRRGDGGRLEARPVRQPRQPALALRDDRPGDLGADRGPGHPLRGRNRHRRHDHRHRALSEGDLRRSRADHRGRPRGLGLLRRQRTPVPRRGRRGGHLARGVRPEHLRPRHRGQRQGLLHHDAAARARGGAARRRLLRARGGGGDPGRGRGRSGRRRGRAAARRRAGLPVEDLQRRLDGRLRLLDLRDRGAADLRRALPQGVGAAGVRARAPARVGRHRDRDSARVQRLTASGHEGGAAGHGGRGRGLGGGDATCSRPWSAAAPPPTTRWRSTWRGPCRWWARASR